MDTATCLKKLEYVGVLNFATVDKYGKPQIRNISAIHYEPNAMPKQKKFRMMSRKNG